MANSSSRYSVLTAAHWGPMLVETDGETVLSSRGALTTGMENSLQSAVRDQVHSNTRVRFPMVRKGFLASPEKPQGIRGQDEFVRVSWDEALILFTNNINAFVRLMVRHRFLLVPTAGVQTACCIRPRHYYNAIWRWQAVIPGIWGIIRPVQHRRSCRMSWGQRSLSTANQLAVGAGT